MHMNNFKYLSRNLTYLILYVISYILHLSDIVFLWQYAKMKVCGLANKKNSMQRIRHI